MARSLTLDSRVESAANAPLELWANDDTSIVVTDLSAPAPPLDTATSGSIDTEGDAIAARRHQNRQVSLTLEVTEPSDAAATNLVTNPLKGTATTGWAVTGAILNAGTTLTMVTDPLAPGPFVGQAVATGASAQQGITISLGSLAAGTWTVRFRVRKDTGGADLQARIREEFGSNTVYLVGASTLTVSTGAYDDVSVTVTLANTGTHSLWLRTATATATTLYLTRVMVASSGPYFDGDTPGCAWSGTPGASASTRPAAGGARFDAILNDLSGKVAKLAAEGGTLRFADAEGNPRTLDLLASQTYEPQFDPKYFLSNAATVPLSFMAKPYARGDELALGTHTETTLGALVFTETGILGDVPALARLTITELSSANQRWLSWGQRSRFYSASEPLLYEAEGTTLSPLTVSTTVAGASNGHVAQHTLSTLGVSICRITMTHTGVYRVFARAQATSGASGNVYVTAGWSPSGIAGQATTNPAATMDPALAGSFVPLDLGLVTFPPLERGAASRHIYLGASSDVATGSIGLDYIWLIPVDDGSGFAQGTTIPALLADTTAELSSTSYQVAPSNVYAPPDSYVGDYLYVPPAGRDGRTLQIIVKASRGAPNTAADSAIDDISAQLTYTPRYLSLL